MKSVVACVLAVAALLLATSAEGKNYTFDGCTTPILGGADVNETASLEWFHGNTTVNKDKYAISPCNYTTFSQCNNQQGYIALFSGKNHLCDVVYSIRYNTEYDHQTHTFSVRFGTLKPNVPDLILEVGCSPGVDVLEGTAKGDKLVFKSETVCPGFNPDDLPVVEKKSLSVGAVVGIVIAALAILTIIMVIFRWKAQKGDEEGDYNRV